jgi:mannosylglycoprotein endo-beta-mannosidase
LYDWFLEQNGGHWGVKDACEPIHVQLNLEHYPSGTSYDVNVVNHTPQELKNMQLHWEVYDLKKSITSQIVPVETDDGTNIIHHAATTKIATLDLSTILSQLDSNLYFVILKLKDGNKTLSRNLYWLSKNGQYIALDTYANPELVATAKGQKTTGGTYTLQTNFKNNATQLSFWNRLQVRKASKIGKEIERVLPVFYEKNYFSLTSLESESIDIDFQHEAKEGIPELWIKGWEQGWRQITINWEN